MYIPLRLKDGAYFLQNKSELLNIEQLTYLTTKNYPEGAALAEN